MVDHTEDEFTKEGAELLFSDKKVEVHAAVTEEDTYRVLNVGASAAKDKSIVPQVSAGAEASLFKGHNPNAQRQFESAEIDVGQAKAGAWATPFGAGVDASVNLVNAKASIFDCTIGLAASTGGGVKDDSLKVEVLGTGFSVGRKISVGAFGTSFGVDLGRLFW